MSASLSSAPAPDAAAILTSTPAPDDSGAQTADRYDWQATMATAHLLAVYLDSLDADGSLSTATNSALICEHHEDWSIVHGAVAEIVSAKHKEPAFGAFTTLFSLAGEGGLLHLYERWKALQMAPRCRLVTTAGLSGDAAAFQNGLAELENGAELDAELVAGLSRAFDRCRTADGHGTPPPEPPAALASFIGCLTLQVGEPRRDHARHAAPGLFALPVAKCLGKPEAAEAIWMAVLVLVRDRMRADGPTRTGGLPRIGTLPGTIDLEARSLSIGQVDAIARVAARNIGGFTVLPAPRPVNRMVIKMINGGCLDNTIQRAEILRLDYRRQFGRRAGLPSEVTDRIRLRQLLLRVVDECTEVVAVDGQPWGGPLWRAVGARLDQIAGSTQAFHLDTDTLLGGVCDLANSCKVWFSPRFDVAEQLQRMRGADHQ